MGRLATAAGIIGIVGIAYLGGICDVPGKVDQVRYGNSVPAQGYYSRPYELKVDISRNRKGEVEAYLVTAEQRLPILQGAKGAQAGAPDYVWQNLPPEQQRAYVAAGFDRLESAAKAEIVARNWRQLDTSARFELVKNDLGVLVEGILEGLKSNFR